MGNVYNGIIGLVVGDALGVPYEFRKRDGFNAVGMAGFGSHNQPAGTWSDDSSLTIATIESFGRLGKIDFNDIMRNFTSWLCRHDFTAHGKVFDVGVTTQEAIYKYVFYHERPVCCGGSSIKDNGNGSLMRILPLVFMPHDVYDVRNLSSLTHAHDIAVFGCEFYLAVASGLLSGLRKDIAVKRACEGANSPYQRLEHIADLKRDEIKSSGYVVDTLEAALWCFLQTENYRDCVLTAVNLGEDTDTTAAVAGGLAGIYYGVGGKNGIPEEWISKIARHDRIKELCDVFQSKFPN